MNEKLQTRAFEHVAPILQAGERPIAASRAMVGKFGSGRLGTIAKHGLVLDGAGGAMAAIVAAAGKQFVVVTDRRVIFLGQTLLGGPGKKVIGEVPRDQVAVAEVKLAMVSQIQLAFGTEGHGVALTFPRSDKKNAEALAQALQPAQVG